MISAKWAGLLVFWVSCCLLMMSSSVIFEAHSKAAVAGKAACKKAKNKIILLSASPSFARKKSMRLLKDLKIEKFV